MYLYSTRVRSCLVKMIHSRKSDDLSHLSTKGLVTRCATEVILVVVYYVITFPCMQQLPFIAIWSYQFAMNDYICWITLLRDFETTVAARWMNFLHSADKNTNWYSITCLKVDHGGIWLSYWYIHINNANGRNSTSDQSNMLGKWRKLCQWVSSLTRDGFPMFYV